MNRVIALFATFMIALEAVAHPGHPTFYPNHTHASFEIDPLLGLAALSVAVAALLIGKAAYRRVTDRR